MRLTFVALVIATASMHASFACAAETTQIPLDRIWGNANLGVSHIYGLEPDLDFAKLNNEDTYRRSYYARLYNALPTRDAEGNRLAGPVFAVPGNDKAALINAHDFYVKGKTPEAIREGEPCSLVFHTIGISSSLKITSVTEAGDNPKEVVIHLEVTPNYNPSARRDVALIPIAQAPRGGIKVSIVTTPVDNPKRPGTQHEPKQRIHQLICQPALIATKPIKPSPVKSPDD